jgi:glycosyltransferase involved in cell wall biosynthesis
VARNDAPLLLDVTRLVWRRWSGLQPTGIDRVCLAYLDRFGDEAQAVVHHRHVRRILDRGSSRDLFALLRSPPKTFRRALAGGGLRRLASRGCTGDGRLYLNLGHTGLDSRGFRRWIDRAGVRPVYFVHDLIPISHPQLCRPGEDVRHSRRMKAVLATASGVIANSSATLQEFERFAAGERLPIPPAVAAWLGADRFELHGPPPPEARRPHFVVLGTIEARKNHLLLLRLWSKLVAKHGGEAPRLLVIGRRGWEAQPVFDLLDDNASLRGHVVEIGDCSDEELRRHFATARALLFPSIAEGFGLPLVEALGSGLPVIASDLPVFREIGQGLPLLLDPGDEAAWERAILDFARPGSAARAAQVERIREFQLPDWASHFRTVESWLTTLD